MQFDIIYTKNHVVISILETLHLSSNLNELKDIVNTLLEQGKRNVVLAFMDGSYLCSQTGAVIVQCWEAIKDQKGTLGIINSNKDIRDFLAIIDMGSLIEMYDSVEELAV